MNMFTGMLRFSGFGKLLPIYYKRALKYSDNISEKEVEQDSYEYIVGFKESRIQNLKISMNQSLITNLGVCREGP